MHGAAARTSQSQIEIRLGNPERVSRGFRFGVGEGEVIARNGMVFGIWLLIEGIGIKVGRYSAEHGVKNGV